MAKTRWKSGLLPATSIHVPLKGIAERVSGAWENLQRVQCCQSRCGRGGNGRRAKPRKSRVPRLELLPVARSFLAVVSARIRSRRKRIASGPMRLVLWRLPPRNVRFPVRVARTISTARYRHRPRIDSQSKLGRRSCRFSCFGLLRFRSSFASYLFLPLLLFPVLHGASISVIDESIFVFVSVFLSVKLKINLWHWKTPLSVLSNWEICVINCVG